MSCPICQAETVEKYRPFCSKRCADIDLARWFNGGYAVPSENLEDAEQALDEIEALSQAERGRPH